MPFQKLSLESTKIKIFFLREDFSFLEVKHLIVQEARGSVSFINSIHSKALQIARFSLPKKQNKTKCIIQLSLEQNCLLSLSGYRTGQQHSNVAEQIEDIFLGESIFS